MSHMPRHWALRCALPSQEAGTIKCRLLWQHSLAPGRHSCRTPNTVSFTGKGMRVIRLDTLLSDSFLRTSKCRWRSSYDLLYQLVFRLSGPKKATLIAEDCQSE